MSHVVVPLVCDPQIPQIIQHILVVHRQDGLESVFSCGDYRWHTTHWYSLDDLKAKQYPPLASISLYLRFWVMSVRWVAFGTSELFLKSETKVQRLLRKRLQALLPQCLPILPLPQPTPLQYLNLLHSKIDDIITVMMSLIFCLMIMKVLYKVKSVHCWFLLFIAWMMVVNEASRGWQITPAALDYETSLGE